MISLTSGTPVTQSPTVAVAAGPNDSSKSNSRTSFHSTSSGPENRTEKFLDRAKFLTSVRKYVSRTTRVSDSGFDLDMSYITPRIIAMGFPASGLEATIRNPRHQVVAYLKKRHPGQYLVFNLCGPERRWIYSALDFAHENSKDGAIIFPIKESNIPSLYQLATFCQQANSWLGIDPSNVVVVHCNSGRARTGLMVCCLLLATNQSPTPEEAVATFTHARSPEKIFSPSQIFALKLFDELLNLSSRSIPIAITSLGLAQYTWTLESVEIGFPNSVVTSIFVRSRSEESGSRIPLPELYKKDHTSLRQWVGREPECPILLELPPNRSFNEDSEITIQMRQGYRKKLTVSWWVFSEMSEQMINHRCSSGEGNSTIFLDPKDLDREHENVYVKINIRYIRI